MRFEGKHGYFKDLAHSLKYFKNAPKSMAYLLCYYTNSSTEGSPFVKENITSSRKFFSGSSTVYFRGRNQEG